MSLSDLSGTWNRFPAFPRPHGPPSEELNAAATTPPPVSSRSLTPPNLQGLGTLSVCSAVQFNCQMMVFVWL